MNQSSNQLRYPAYRGGFNNAQFNGFCNFGSQYQHSRNGPPQRFPGPNNRQGYFNHNNPQQYRNPVVSNLRCGPPPPSSSPQWNARPQQRRFCHYEDDKRRRTSIDITPSLAPTLALPLSTARPPPKGPRTPPYPPPASEESDTEINSPAFEPISPKKSCNAESNESRRRQRKELKKIQRRRNSSASRPKRRLSQNARKSQKAEEPSPLNTAVQAYLLQVLTSQPPPGVVPTGPAPSANDAVPATYLSQTALLHPPPPLSPEPNPTPPPLPPTPEIPPPPPLPAQQSYVDDEPLCFTSSLQSSEKGEESTRNATPGMLAIDVLDTKNNDKDALAEPLVRNRPKHKTISSRMANEKAWTMEEAEIAYKAEQDLTKKVHKSTLYVRFPDPPLNSDIIKAYSDDIESVYFQNPICERYCFVHLKDSVDVDKAIQTLSNVRFGDGFLKVELRELQFTKEQNTLDTIDPYTLYCGNLAQTIPCKKLKEYFPKASRIDVGFAQRMKNTRYAFVRYKTVNDALEAFKRMVNCEIEGRTIVLRFRRVAKPYNAEREDEEHTEDFNMINTSMVPSEQIDAGETLLNESFSSNQIVSAVESHLESDSNLQHTANVMEDETVDNEAHKDNENNLESYQIEDNVADKTGNNILSTQCGNDCQKAKDGFVNTPIEVETNVLESNVFITTDENQINKEDAQVSNETNSLEHYRKEQNETETSGNNVLDKQIENATQQAKDIYANTAGEEMNEPETMGNDILGTQIENATQQAKDMFANTAGEELNEPETFGNNILDKRIENATKKSKGVFANTAVDVESNGSESIQLITSTDKEANKSDNNLSDASAEKDNAALNAPIDNEVIPQMSTTQVENQTDPETNTMENNKVVIKNSNTVVTDKSISDAETATDNICANENTNSICGSIDGEAMAPSITADSIKSEPGHDPDDYIESNTAAAAIKRQKCNVNIKEEASRLETEYEFFSVGGGSSQNDIDSQEHYPITDTAVSSSDESDSSCNLTDFLKLCESSRDTSTAEEICIQTAPQPSKRKEDTGNAKPKISLRRNIASSALPISREIKEELINEEVSLMETSDTSNSLRYKETGAEIKEEVNIDVLDQDILIIDSEDCQLPTEEDNTGVQPTMNIAQVVDDADLVPSNAFSVKENNNDCRAKLVSTPFQVKEEPMEWEKPASTNTTNRNDSLEHRKVKTETKLNKTKNNSGTKVILKRKSLVAVAPVETNKRKPIVLSSTNDDDDDDKVPINNALCSRQRSLACFDLTLDDEPPRITIKSELETEDLFLLPKNVQSSRKETSDKNLTLKQKENTNIQNLNRKVSRSLRNGTASKKINPEHSDGHDTDDDVILITDDDTTQKGRKAFPKPIRVKSSSDPSTLHIKREISSPAPPSISDNSKSHKISTAKGMKKSFLDKPKTSRYGDKLDRLFELLNSDSEEEL